MENQPDPKYPDRPNHQDFWKLSDCLIYNGQRSETETLPEILNIDDKSLNYVATQRGTRAAQFYNLLFVGTNSKVNRDVVFSHTAAWLDGFATGREFEKRRNDG